MVWSAGSAITEPHSGQKAMSEPTAAPHFRHCTSILVRPPGDNLYHKAAWPVTLSLVRSSQEDLVRKGMGRRSSSLRTIEGGENAAKYTRNAARAARCFYADAGQAWTEKLATEARRHSDKTGKRRVAGDLSYEFMTQVSSNTIILSVLLCVSVPLWLTLLS
jgi:hypothetical protein